MDHEKPIAGLGFSDSTPIVPKPETSPLASISPTSGDDGPMIVREPDAARLVKTGRWMRTPIIGKITPAAQNATGAGSAVSPTWASEVKEVREARERAAPNIPIQQDGHEEDA